MKISIIILTWQRRMLLENCIDSIMRSRSSYMYEIIVVVNGKDPETEQYIKTLDCVIPIYLITRQGRGEARNNALAHSTGEVLYFLDDDVVISDNALQQIGTAFEEDPDLFILGGPNIGFPDESLWQQSMSISLGSWLGAGPYYKRYKRTHKMFPCTDEHLILCNLTVRRSVFTGNRFFNNVISNEENLFLQESSAKGLKMMHSSDVFVFHHRASNIKTAFLRYANYGRGRADNMLLNTKSSIPHFAFLTIGVGYILFMVIISVKTLMLSGLLYLCALFVFALKGISQLQQKNKFIGLVPYL